MSSPATLSDRELEQYRSLLDTPTEFKSGFGWTTVVGIFFCGLIMMPGGIYLSLITGNNIGIAAQWVTVILFMEVARRALQPLSTQNLVVLLHAAHVMMAAHILFPGGPCGEMVYRAYLVGSQAVRDAGMLGEFPTWYAPPFDSPAITERNLFHPDWIQPLAIAFFLMVVALVKRYTLGYFFFRLTSDVERLPFPLAPINAQGAMALAEAEETDPAQTDPTATRGQPKKKSERWRLFSLGAYIGIGFGTIQIGIPAVTGLLLAQPFYLIPQPFVDTTTVTERVLPATPTGIAIDLAVVLLGFVLPFWSVIGTFVAIALTIVLNPILHAFGVLDTWQPGMDTVNTTFSNQIDFWLSFGIGAGFAIAAVSIYSTFRDIAVKMRRTRDNPDVDIWTPPRQGRGDYPLWIALILYSVVGLASCVLIWALLDYQITIAFFALFFTFIYNPFISYVNARLLGISGQNVVIPYIKETGFLLSGSRGIDIWLAPVPLDNFGFQAQAFRVNELTGVDFWSLIKTDLVAVPILFVLSFGFWAFIWHSDPIPSEVFPAAQINWELHAKQQVLLFSSTFSGADAEGQGAVKAFKDTEFGKAINPSVIGIGFGGVTILYAVLTAFGLPVMFVYGLIRGFGNLPHYMLLEVVGALASRFYLQRKYGPQNFLRMAPTLFAGYMTGVGLIGMATIALRLINTAVSSTPF